MKARPRLAMVSIGIRRDLLAPLRYMTRFELRHLYHQSAYGDLVVEDMDATLLQYGSPGELYRKLVASGPDVIQGVEPFSYYTQPYLWAGYIAARRSRARLVVSAYENRPLDVKFGRARGAMLQSALRTYFASACLVIVPNDGARRNALRCGARVQRVVRGLWGMWGVDTNEFRPRAVRARNAVPTVLFAGRLHEEKGVFVLAQAWRDVRAQIPEARLVFAGDGPARGELEKRLVEAGQSDSVEFLGVVKNRQMPDLMGRADVVCAPSITTRKWAEQVGSVQLQAMACGVPVVSTRSGAIPEYVPDGAAGVLVEEGNAVALANALSALLRDPARIVEMGEYGRKYACAHYDARGNVERGEALVMEHCLARGV